MSLDNQKHLLFFVPNYDGTGSSDGAPLTYLKLGSAKSSDSLDTAAKRGDDLLESAGLSTSSYASFFVDDARGGACASAKDASSSYVQATHDDEAHDGGDCLDATVVDAGTTYYRSDANGSYTTDESRSELSAELLGDGSSVDARGGWRDHTDGNRITTVRGDRVDVVVGNYKRVVFGRVSGTRVGASSYEVSGGHAAARTSTDVVQQYAVERVQEPNVDGNTYWKLVESADNADTVERFSGTLAEYHDGPARKLRIGTGDTGDDHNPEVTLTHRFGAKKRTVDAKEGIEERVEADTYTETVSASGAKLQTTAVAEVIERQRGAHFSRLAEFKREHWAASVRQVEVAGASVDALATGVHYIRHGKRLNFYMGLFHFHMHVGAQVVYNYGSRSRYLLGTWVKVATGSVLQLDAGSYGHGSLFFWNYSAARDEYTLGKWNIRFQQNKHGVLQTKATALLAKL